MEECTCTEHDFAVTAANIFKRLIFWIAKENWDGMSETGLEFVQDGVEIA